MPISGKVFLQKDIDLWLMGLSKEELEAEEEFNQMLSRNRKS